MMLLVGHGLMGPSGPSCRSGARRDAWHRASLATHPKGRFAPPKAGFASRRGGTCAPLPILQHRHAGRALPRRKQTRSNRIQLTTSCSRASNVTGLLTSIYLALNAVMSTVGYHDLRVAKEGFSIDDIAAVFD